MNIKTKIAFLTAAALTFGGTVQAYASVDGYLLKDKTNNTYQYNLEELKDSILDISLGNGSKLYTEFKNQQNTSQFYLVHDSEGKYVSFDHVKEALIDKTLNKEEFNLNAVVKELQEAEKPSQVEYIKVEDNNLMRELHILKNETTLDGEKIEENRYKRIVVQGDNVKVQNIDIHGEIVLNPGVSGKATLLNVKCTKVKILSGDRVGIHFDNVQAGKVEKNENVDIEIQYEKSTSGQTPHQPDKPQVSDAERINMLKKAQSQLSTVNSKITNTREKTVITKVAQGISKALSDKNYDYTNDVKEAKRLYDNLTEIEKIDLQDYMFQFVDILNVKKLLDIYGIDFI